MFFDHQWQQQAQWYIYNIVKEVIDMKQGCFVNYIDVQIAKRNNSCTNSFTERKASHIFANFRQPLGIEFQAYYPKKKKGIQTKSNVQKRFAYLVVVKLSFEKVDHKYRYAFD